ncbi:MAG: L-rhamnose/proton symporter RhaT [Acidobacteriota bacterium]
MTGSANYLAGFLAMMVAGVSNGSFAVPAKRVVTWRWEHIWFVYSVSGMGILPLCVASLWAPGVLVEVIAKNSSMALQVSGFGISFGVGALLFGLSLARLGLAISNAMVNGIVVLLGSISPLMIGAAKLDGSGKTRLFAGLLLLSTSIVLCAAASLARDKAQGGGGQHTTSIKGSLLGILIATMSGVLSAMLNTGFAFGGPLIEKAVSLGHSPLLSSLAVWIPVLSGGLVINVTYTSFLIHRSKSWQLFWSGEHTKSCWTRCFAMGLLWFSAIFIYGYGVSLVGSIGLVYGFAAITAASILTSNVWSAVTGEWRGSGNKPKLMMVASTLLLLTSFLILAIQRAPS